MAKQEKLKISEEMKEKLKGKETWVTTYEGHEITIVNKLKVTLYIDSVEVAKQKGLISSNVTLSADIPDTDKTVIATLYSSGKDDDAFIINCRFIIGSQSEATHGFTMKDGEFKALTEEEEKQYLQIKKERSRAATDAILISNL